MEQPPHATGPTYPSALRLRASVALPRRAATEDAATTLSDPVARDSVASPPRRRLGSPADVRSGRRLGAEPLGSGGTTLCEWMRLEAIRSAFRVPASGRLAALRPPLNG